MNSWEKVKSKIFLDKKQLKIAVDKLKSDGKKIVFTNGCFDLLHSGHFDYLSKTKDLGDFLIIAVNSDSSVKRLKGDERPIKSELERLEGLACLEFVDAVVLFEEDTPKLVIEYLIPNVLVKGGDYTKETIVGADFVENKGGEVKVIPFKEGYSTTNLVTKIKNLSK